MRLYHYKAIDQTGAIYKGSLQARCERDLTHLLQERELYLVKIKRKSSPLTALSVPAGMFRVSDRDLEELCLHMAALDHAGITALEILESLRETSEQKFFKASLTTVIEAFKKGTSLADSFALEPRLFDATFCSMVAAAEQMGALGATFDQLAQLFKWRYELKNHIWKSLRYPAVLTAMVIGLTVILMTWVIPQLEVFLRGMHQELPPLTRALMFISRHALVFLEVLAGTLGVVFLSMIGIRRLSHQGAIRLDRWLLCVPLTGRIFKKIALQRFLQIFVSLVDRGIPLLDSLKMAMENVRNLFIRQNLLRLHDEILKGASFSQGWLALPLLEPLIGRLASTGESSGQFAQSLRHGIPFLRRDIEHLSQRFAAVLEPTLVLFLGGMMIWIAVAIFLPLYDQGMALE